ncbi:hypothetical protein ABCA12_0824 [Acinetobacter junii]|uniref:hypothetical protein n=1 Tax=Acinetobacter junii TaxID=40215 RepID=UPI00191F2F45|nr:hypothetical protein [Acinetobacter junii]QQV65501.1 hypothetical protein ABCA12_0824 [Acinetobacter junii]
MKKMMILLLFSTSIVHAELKTLDSQALREVEGQAGADLSLKFSLNHTSTYQFDDAVGGACDKTAMSNTGLGYCHLGISVNKRFVKETALGNGNWSVPESDPTSTNPARKLWLVFKGIQGTVNIQKLGLDGVDLVYKNDSGTEKIKPAIQLGFDATLPILIRNLGYNALAIEMDNFTSYIDPTTKQVIENTSTATAQDYGYLKATTYASNHTSVYDQNKEIGFMGLRMNGNLALQGNIKMFACDGSHPRC